MPQLINRVPPGLLSLLGIQSTGRNPVLLADDLQAVLDLTQSYFIGQSQVYGDVTAALGTTGFFSGAVGSPSAGELWVFSQVVIACGVLPAATTYRVRPAVAQVGTGEILHVSSMTASGTAGERPVAATTEPIYVRPNELLGVFVESVTLGTASPFAIYGRRTILRV